MSFEEIKSDTKVFENRLNDLIKAQQQDEDTLKKMNDNIQTITMNIQVRMGRIDELNRTIQIFKELSLVKKEPVKAVTQKTKEEATLLKEINKLPGEKDDKQRDKKTRRQT